MFIGQTHRDRESLAALLCLQQNTRVLFLLVFNQTSRRWTGVRLFKAEPSVCEICTRPAPRNNGPELWKAPEREPNSNCCPLLVKSYFTAEMLRSVVWQYIWRSHCSIIHITQQNPFKRSVPQLQRYVDDDPLLSLVVWVPESESEFTWWVFLR